MPELYYYIDINKKPYLDIRALACILLIVLTYNYLKVI